MLAVDDTQSLRSHRCSPTIASVTVVAAELEGYTDEFGVSFASREHFARLQAESDAVLVEWKASIALHGRPRGWVYFIEAIGADLSKIGSSGDPDRRLAQLQTGSGHRLRLIGVIPSATPSFTEACVQKRFHRARVRPDGEWFKPTGFLRRYIADWATVPLTWL
jgi:hypothetical protein